MGLAHSPKIVTDGLVFAYDMGNPQKSWKGAPTTNLLTSLGNPEAEYARGEFGQYFNLVTPFEQNGLVPYSLSFEAKVSKPGNVSVYMQNGSYTKYSFVSQGIAVTTEWQKFKLQNLTPSGPTAAWQSNSPADNRAMLATYTGYGSGINPTLKNLQLELGPYATPFVNGTRSNTQAIVDLTGNNTVTATSLTYASDGTFAFGSGNSVTIPNLVANGQPYTILLMAKPNSLGTAAYNSSSGRRTILKGDNNWNPGIWVTQNTIRSHSVTEYRDTNINWSDLRTSLVGMVFDGVNCYNIFDAIIQSGTRTAYAPGVPSSITIGNETAGGTSPFWDGQIYYMLYYNRALSAQEIQQNFNALRGRYGL
jgi:hypothetical protein